MLRRFGVLLAVLSLPTFIFACGDDDASAPVTPAAGTDGGGDADCPAAPGTDAGDAAPNPLPTGAIVFPSFEVWTPDAKGRVVGTATPPPSRTIVQVTVNGTPAMTKNGYANWTVDADLAPGSNPLTLTVIDSTGATSTTTGVKVTSKVPMRNNVVTEAMLVKDGVVYAGDGNEIVSFPVGGGPRTSLAKLDDATDGFHLFALDGSTLYVVTRKARFGSVPLAGGTITLLNNVPANQRAAAVTGGNMVLLSRFIALGGGPGLALTSYPATGGELMPVALSYGGAAIDSEVLDYELIEGSFYVTLPNHKPIIIPAAGGAVTDLDISRTTDAGDEYPILIKSLGTKLYVSFDPAGKTWFTTGINGGALTPATLVMPADAAPSASYAIAGEACFVPALFGGIERVPLAGGPATYLSENDIADHAFFGIADATDIFLTTPKGVTAYSRGTFQKRELTTWPDLDDDFDHRSVATTVGDRLYVAQGTRISVITKSTGATKVLVPTLNAPVPARAIVADDKTLYVRNQDFELYDATTGAYLKTNLFSPPNGKSSTAIAADATSIYTTTVENSLVKVPKATAGDFIVWEPFGTPAISPTSILLAGETLWAIDDQRRLYRMPVATGATTKVLDGATAGFAGANNQYLLTADDKLVVSIQGSLSRVMITSLEAGGSYFLR